MKTGLITSTAMHAVALGLGLLSFSSPVPFNAAQTEALPVLLVPLSDEMSIRKGDLTAAKTEKPAPKPTTKPQEKPDAENVGEGKIDTKMPLKPQEKPREVKATPPPGTPDAKSDIMPQEKPVEKPIEQAEREPAALPPRPEEPASEPALPEKVPDNSKAQAAEVSPKSEPPQEKPVEKPIEQAERKPAALPPRPEEPASEPALPEKVPLPDAKPQQVAKTTRHKPKEEARQSASSVRGDSVEDILAMADDALVDKTKTQGGGAKRSEEPAAFGSTKDVGNDSFQQTLNNIIGSCVQRNWNLAAINGSTAYDLRVVVNFRLNQDGSLDGEPDLAPTGGDDAQRGIISVQAREALKKCAPFALPADRYNQWHNVTINMKAYRD